MFSLGVWFQRRAPRQRLASASVIIFIVGAESQLALFVILRAITFRKARQGPLCADRIAPTSARVKDLA